MGKSTHNCLPHPELAALLAHPKKLPTATVPISVRIASSGPPDRIFIGKIITMDDALPQAEAMAVKRDEIVAVGTVNDITQLAGPDTKTIDLGSQVLYPGLIESHMHLWVTAINYDWIDCSPFVNKSVSDVKARIAKAAKTAKPGEWILGKLYDPSLLPGQPDLTVQNLDPIAPNNPVFIFNASMHFGYVNSKALEIGGITDKSKDPPGGAFGRSKNGKLNGVLSEMSAIAPFLKHVDKITPEIVAKNIQRISDDAAKVGVTTMREAATGALFGPKEIGLLHHLQQQGAMKTRVSLALVDDAAKTWHPSPETEYLSGNEHVWIGARKLVTDGSNQGKSGYQSVPYIGTEDKGKADITPKQLKDRLQWCQDNGWQVMVHANGDAAVEAAINTFHELGPSDLRHRIEHCSMINDDKLFLKMKEVGVSPSFLINHVYYWGKTLRDNVFGPKRIHMLDRTGSALKAGLKFTMHSDYNVSPIDPLHYVKVAVTRTMWDGGKILGADQRVTIEEALRAVTIDAAWQINAENKLGSITPGKFADFVILEQDPLETEPAEIDKIVIKQTWRGGTQTYAHETNSRS